jgi:hypothetical protein
MSRNEASVVSREQNSQSHEKGSLNQAKRTAATIRRSLLGVDPVGMCSRLDYHFAILICCCSRQPSEMLILISLFFFQTKRTTPQILKERANTLQPVGMSLLKIVETTSVPTPFYTKEEGSYPIR